ncbi:MAG: Mrp/NBP35 family ATP-binding protein [Rhodobiaceae bacterium]|nr:Mrp/NBP35 family ATP-binding protein [Rhodobiaceae bacterium]MCC0018371.1 Mrp/NBP35 family ATP-binding protein [Rhodobiaceae bacterium]MCC0051164.1 Mrp/NBP35 family ATP-binding protein [Rhodobiaceae bacterium]MCC0060229.1 Mrp/NBP35 family ATP-binding protein [Rhodobiaceae bacterium]
MSVTKEAVLEALKRVRGPDLKRDLVETGIVSDIFISGAKVIFSISVPADMAQKLEPMRQAAERVVSEIPGVEKAIVSMTAEKAGGGNGSAPAAKAPPPGNMAPPPPMAGKGPGGQQAAPQAAGVPGVKHIIAVASGKGGVGKSTTTANLALALQTLGLSVGVLDADIYGPSQPRLLGVTGKPEPVHGRVLKPLEGYGLKVMSMGFLVEEDTPMIWRGPMVISAITQMLREVQWGELDVLVVDMPPGTGDAQLTLAQQVPLSGAVIVSTPQDLALIDARKGINMFRRVDVPILGIIENMSYFLCPSCGDRSDIFGNGGAKAEAEKIGVPFLGEVPLHMDIREKSDAGRPPVVSDPQGPHAKIFGEIARTVWAELSDAENAKAAPAIVME